MDYGQGMGEMIPRRVMLNFKGNNDRRGITAYG